MSARVQLQVVGKSWPGTRTRPPHRQRARAESSPWVLKCMQLGRNVKGQVAANSFTHTQVQYYINLYISLFTYVECSQTQSAIRVCREVVEGGEARGRGLVGFASFMALLNFAIA